jgi:hypothetical protein
MHRVLVAAVLALSVFMLISLSAAASTPLPVIATTMTVNETGAIHVKVVQTVADNPDGAVDYHFDLQKIYHPSNVIIYDYATGKPLNFFMKETSDVYSYEADFDRPYYEGYTFVVEYDWHKRIIYEGNGVYSLGMSSAMDMRRVDRTYTVVLPVQNFTYLGYNEALDHATSETNTGDSIRIVFHDVNDAGSDYSWEVRFGAKGIDDEVRKADVPEFKVPIPGMSFIAAITALVIFAIGKKR